MNIALKSDVEDLLHMKITDDQFKEALQIAERKQDYIFEQEKDPLVLQHWYLAKLTEEYVKSLALSKFTMDLCRTLHDMEKEHSANCQSAPMDNHIVSDSAL